ncbi:MAG: phospho-sugar mutase [Oscillospiraceae bacterium]|nr:phospho-sugar mutase [Oscillospiraceae bacterium]
MESEKVYEIWKARLAGASDGKILEQMTPEDVTDAFSGNISFGTGGFRGIMGLGTNRMNRYTVERVTHGLAKTIMRHAHPKSVGIAYDTRYNSAEYARIVSETLSGHGIDVYIFGKPMPTPALSFAIRHMKLGWGVIITASHNPKEYNGYKVYNSRGVQVTDQMAKEITGDIDSIGFFEPLPDAARWGAPESERQNLLNEGLSHDEQALQDEQAPPNEQAPPDEQASLDLQALQDEQAPPDERLSQITVIGKDVERAFVDYIVSFVAEVAQKGDYKGVEQTDVLEGRSPSGFPFVYSALHGTGANAIPDVLKRIGFDPICIQQEPDGDFGGLKTPNPEEPAAYEKAIEEAEKCGAKILCATDPDSDRVGVMLKARYGYEPLNGNQIGALLIDYLAQTRGVSPGDTVISTIVSGLLGEAVSKAYGLEFVHLLTGFKYIGEYAEQLPSEDKRFFFGYEESYGFLAGDGARDKDAVMATALIVQMAEYYDRKGITLKDRLEELSKKHGYCMEKLHSVNIDQERIQEIMNRLRRSLDTSRAISEVISEVISEDGNTNSGVEASIATYADIKKIYDEYANKPVFEELTAIEDFLFSRGKGPGVGGLPPSDVVKLYFEFGDGVTGWAAIRPSGTEPKIKLYTGVRAKTLKTAQKALDSLTSKMIAELAL